MYTNPFLAAYQDKVTKAQEAITKIKNKLRDIGDKVDAVAIERAHIALDYAVCTTPSPRRLQY